MQHHRHLDKIKLPNGDTILLSVRVTPKGTPFVVAAWLAVPPDSGDTGTGLQWETLEITDASFSFTQYMEQSDAF